MDAFALRDVFTLEEAFNFIHLKVDLNGESGVVSGLLAFNSEVEVVVKFADELKQFTKSEFMSSCTVIYS